MSRITDVIVLAGMQDDVMTPLTRPAADREWRGWFNRITGSDSDRSWVVNGKGPACEVFVAAFNHLNRPALLADLERLPWEHPYEIQVLIHEEEDECFGLWMFSRGRLREVPLPMTARSERTGILERLDDPGGDL